MPPSRPLHVVCALIERDGRVLAAQRAAGGLLGGRWEFPGGKVEPGEHPAAALRREIREELGLDIEVGEELPVSEHDYGTFAIALRPFRCSSANGEPHPVEHAAVRWCVPEELPSLDWAAADMPIVADYLARRGQEGGP